MNWIFFAILTASSMAAFNLVAKTLGVYGVHPAYSSLVMGVVAMAVYIAVFAYWQSVHGDVRQPIFSPATMWAALAGLCIAAINMFAFFTFASGAPVGVASAVINTITIFLSVIIGYAIFKEQLDITKIAGILLAVASIYLLTKGK